MSRKSLQIATVVLGLIPVVSGLLGMMGVHDPLYTGLGVPADATLDSNLRFFNGVWIMLGLAAWWTVPAIERRGDVYRLIWGAIFLGGLGRLLSMGVVGLPFAPFIAFTVLEIVGAPLFILWQRRVALAHRRP